MNYFLEGRELDIFLPSLSFAIEVNGQYHYGLDPLYLYYYSRLHHIHFSAGIVARDAEKKRLCFSRGITLLIVPFWWNGHLSSLASSILELRPDLINYIDKKFVSSPISMQIPERFKGSVEFPLLMFSAFRSRGC